MEGEFFYGSAGANNSFAGNGTVRLGPSVLTSTDNASVYPNGTEALASPVYYPILFRIIATPLSAIIFAMGFLGNILVVAVIFRTKSMHTPTNCYIMSLAVADCLVLLSATVPAIPEPFFQINEWPFGRALCSILVFLQYVGVDASAMSITAFTVERYIAICHPMKAQTICTVSRAKKIIAGLWVLTVLYCTPWLGLTTVNSIKLADGNAIEECRFRLSREDYLTYYMADLIIFYIIPFVIATVLYSLIARILFRSTLTNSSDRPNGRKNSEVKRTRHNNARIQVVRMLVVIVVVFATLWLPYRGLVVYNSFARHKFMDLWFLLFSRTMVYINSAINPILYNALSVKFRRAFRDLLCCGVKQKYMTSFMYSDGGSESHMARRMTSYRQVRTPERLRRGLEPPTEQDSLT